MIGNGTTLSVHQQNVLFLVLRHAVEIDLIFCLRELLTDPISTSVWVPGILERFSGSGHKQHPIRCQGLPRETMYAGPRRHQKHSGVFVEPVFLPLLVCVTEGQIAPCCNRL
jgi:hypothetical protein